jgi:hypothetical protein
MREFRSKDANEQTRRQCDKNPCGEFCTRQKLNCFFHSVEFGKAAIGCQYIGSTRRQLSSVSAANMSQISDM